MRPKLDSIGLLANCGGVSWALLVNGSICTKQKEGLRNTKAQARWAEMLLIRGWLHHAQERGLNFWASASSFSCPRCLFCLSTDVVPAISWPIDRPYMPCCPTPRRTGPISKFNLQTLDFPRFGPWTPYHRLPRDSSPPLLPVGSQVEKTTIS